MGSSRSRSAPGPAGLRLVPDLAVALPSPARGGTRVHVPAAARDPLLRRAPATRGRLPPRDRAAVPDLARPAPATSRGSSAPTAAGGRPALRPRRGHRDRRPQPARVAVPPARAGSRLPVQAHRVRATRRRSRPACPTATPAARRSPAPAPTASRATTAASSASSATRASASGRTRRSRPATPTSSRGASSGSLRRRRAGGRAGRGRLALRAAPAGAGRGDPARAPRAGAHQPVADLRLHPAQHARAAVRRRARAARAQLRDRPRQGRPHVRPRRRDARAARRCCPGCPGHRAVLPLSARPREGEGARRRLRHARAADRRLGADRRGRRPARAAAVRHVACCARSATARGCTACRARSITPALRRRIQLSADGDWLADYPAPSAYLPQFFGCHGGLTNGYVCDRTLDRLMARATALQLSDPRRAAAAWAKADRRITDQALWVPTVEPARARARLEPRCATTSSTRSGTSSPTRRGCGRHAGRRRRRAGR